MSRSRTSRYDEGEVRGLIECYEVYRASADTTRRGLRALIAIADLNRVLRMLPVKYLRVVLLHGLLGLSERETAGLLQINSKTVPKRYRYALEDVLYLLNGDE
jgi:DNA-directed RNA polymerase specialized sigma24 family protein